MEDCAKWQESYEKAKEASWAHSWTAAQFQDEWEKLINTCGTSGSFPFQRKILCFLQVFQNFPYGVRGEHSTAWNGFLDQFVAFLAEDTSGIRFESKAVRHLLCLLHAKCSASPTRGDQFSNLYHSVLKDKYPDRETHPNHLLNRFPDTEARTFQERFEKWVEKETDNDLLATVCEEVVCQWPKAVAYYVCYLKVLSRMMSSGSRQALKQRLYHVVRRGCRDAVVSTDGKYEEFAELALRLTKSTLDVQQYSEVEEKLVKMSLPFMLRDSVDKCRERMNEEEFMTWVLQTLDSTRQLRHYTLQQVMNIFLKVFRSDGTPAKYFAFTHFFREKEESYQACLYCFEEEANKSTGNLQLKMGFIQLLRDFIIWKHQRQLNTDELTQKMADKLNEWNFDKDMYLPEVNHVDTRYVNYSEQPVTFPSPSPICLPYWNLF